MKKRRGRPQYEGNEEEKKKLYYWRYHIGLSLEEVAKEMGYTSMDITRDRLKFYKITLKEVLADLLKEKRGG